IAITVDFSDQDRDTIWNAIQQGGREAEYRLIHIVESAGARYLAEESDDKETRLDKEKTLVYQEELSKQGYKVSSEIGFGNPVAAISKISKAWEADLLVMGAHGHRGIKDIIFGSTVDAVRHKVGISVLIVNEKKR